ncbi:MAG: methyltransferase domain-containing protein [Nitrospirae bacterium]|nr:methyltransferase domain-containing protein [Nitrospirota bacterium]
MTETKKRIESESEFQNARIEKGGSPRKFQHLIRDEYPFLLKVLGDVKDKKILTMGCSTGGVTPFARQGAWNLGVDISSLAIKELLNAIKEENLKDYAQVGIMDCENLALTDNYFDVVLFLGVLHHLDIEKAMMESYRVLKFGGKIYMTEPLGLHPLVNLYRLLTPGARTSFEHPLRPKDFKIIKKYFRVDLIKGFCLTSIFSLIPLYIFKSERLYEVFRKLFIKLDDYLYDKFPFLCYCSWSAVIVLNKE